MKNLRTLATVSLLIAVAACVVGGDYEPEDVEVAEARFEPSKLREGECQDWTDENGRQWISKPAVVVDSEEENAMPHLPENAEEGKPNPYDLSVEELAEAMRPVAYWRGCEYTTAEAPLDWAQAAIERRGIGETNPEYEGRDPGPPSAEEGHGDIEQRAVFGSDNRERRQDHTSNPMRRQVRLHINGTTLSWGCSASMIGQSTAITAAHCLHNGTGWKGSVDWSPGVNSQATVVRPWGHATAPTYPAATTQPYEDCSYKVVPGGWAGSDYNWDFAILEFKNFGGSFVTGCGYTPGDQVGWFAWGWQSDSLIQDYDGYIYGYPGQTSSDGSGGGDAYTGCAGGHCYTPSIWGWGGPVGTNLLNPYRVYTHIDVTPQQSGAGIYNKYDGTTRRVFGVISGVQGSSNFGRRIDADAATWIKGVSALN
jgi:V8-like Glu-specific endopeptidase